MLTLMMRSFFVIGTLLVIPCVALAHNPPSHHGQIAIDVKTDVPVKMRDGILLYADIYRPVDKGAHPVLLVRTPYDKTGEGETCRRAAQRGYVCITQDVRGRYTSQGDWYPFKNEPNDGYDSVEWAAMLPYSNGKVAMFGDSYLGATQWLAAIMRPPHLAAIQPSLTASNYHDGWVYQGGTFEQWFDQSWTSILAVDTLRRKADKTIHAKEWAEKLPESRYPVLRADDLTSLAPYYFDWLTHPNYDDYWKHWSIEENYPNLSVAALHIAGWYDVFLRGSLRNYIGMRAHAHTQWARDHQHLIIGPWIHDGPMNGKSGDVDFGQVSAIDESTAMLDWYNELFQKRPEKPDKPVRIFVMGINEWRSEDDWPLARTNYTRYYLRSAGRANSSSGDGSLSTANPALQGADSFFYDPANPVPTHGGNLCCSREGDQVPSGAFDQSEIEKRSDVLVYTTDPFGKDFEVTGPLRAEIYISSSAEDTDVTAKLVDVWPNGFAQNLADGIQRLRYRNSPTKSELMQPGTIYKTTVDMGATSNVFRKGHRLRLEISSSNFPHFDRNLNTGESPEKGSTFIKTENRIYHDLAHPSAIILPVTPVH
jgi:putative CocE/NonD family hydrolase